MAFNFDSARSVDSSQQEYMFKQGVKYSYFKADETRPISFRILPAFSEHDGPITNKMDYVKAVSIIDGKPVISDWIFSAMVSRSYVKGAFPVVSRRTLIEKDVTGNIVVQEDPLTEVIDYCAQNDREWGYIIEDQGKWGDANRIPAKLPPIKPQYLMNVITFDDEKPGVKLAVISSVMAINDLCRKKQGSEGIALRQVTYDVSDEEIARNPSAMFQYGDITDPNGAPVLKYGKALADDGSKKVYRISVGLEVDPATGRQRVQRVAVTPEHMALRQDLAHPETYINIPTVEDQVKQLVRIMSGRNKDGYHELDMLRVAINRYASLIPEIPFAPGAVNQVRGFTPPAQPTPSFQPAQQPAQSFQPTQQPAVFTPTAQPAAHTQPTQHFTPTEAPQQTFRPKQGQVPSFVPTAPAQPEPKSDAPEQQKVAEVAGEATFNSDDWVAMAMRGGN